MSIYTAAGKSSISPGRLPRGAAALRSPTLLLGTPHPCSVCKPNKLIISTTWTLVDDALDCNWYPVKKGRYTCSHRPKEYWTRDMDQLGETARPICSTSLLYSASSKLWKPQTSRYREGISQRRSEMPALGNKGGRQERLSFIGLLRFCNLRTFALPRIELG